MNNQNNTELELLEGIINSLDKIRDIAFSIPAPNVYTPRIAEQIFFLVPIIKKAIFTARTASPYQSIAEEMAEALEKIRALEPNGHGFRYVMPLRADCGYIAEQALTKFNQLKEKKDA